MISTNTVVANAMAQNSKVATNRTEFGRIEDKLMKMGQDSLELLRQLSAETGAKLQGNEVHEVIRKVLDKARRAIIR